MQCLKCSHKNPGTVAFCQRCGAKMDFTADEIEGALIEKKRGEVADSAAFYARQALTFGAALFLVALTCLVLSTGAPETWPPAVPSASSGTKYLEVDYKLDTELPRLQVPLEVRKK